MTDLVHSDHSMSSEFIATEPKLHGARLEPGNRGRSIEEGLQARVGDPLFFLGRQWQLGEFRAHNGGHIVRAEVDVSTKPLDGIVRGEPELSDAEPERFDLQQPLEMQVESETQAASGTPRAKGWDPENLAYKFSVLGGDTRVIAHAYDGDRLEWYSVNLQSKGQFDTDTTRVALKPSRISFPGAPLPRWWSFEDRHVDLGDIRRPHLNILATLAMEFTLLHSNNWYVVPLQHPVGHIRYIDHFVVMDSFGIVSKVAPVIDESTDKQGWEVFTLTHEDAVSDGRVFYMPNNLYHALQGDPVEEVSFIRDDGANLVWAIEHRYEVNPGNVRNRHDEETTRIAERAKAEHYWDTHERAVVRRGEVEGDGEPGNRFIGPVALYEPKVVPPEHWIPYQPQQQGDKEHFVLRRSRTKDDLSGGLQYKGVLLTESKFLFEEKVPQVGVRLSRVDQLARDSDRRTHVWRSRKKKSDMPRKSSEMQFDSLVERY